MQRIENLKASEEAEDADFPDDASSAAELALGSEESADEMSSGKARLSRAVRGDIFRAVVLAKTKELKHKKEQEDLEQVATKTGHLSS